MSGLKLSPLHRALVEVANDEPAAAKKLARLAGYPYNSRLRESLANLVRMGLLERLPEGYRRRPGALLPQLPVKKLTDEDFIVAMQEQQRVQRMAISVAQIEPALRELRALLAELPSVLAAVAAFQSATSDAAPLHGLRIAAQE